MVEHNKRDKPRHVRSKQVYLPSRMSNNPLDLVSEGLTAVSTFNSFISVASAIRRERDQIGNRRYPAKVANSRVWHFRLTGYDAGLTGRADLRDGPIEGYSALVSILTSLIQYGQHHT